MYKLYRVERTDDVDYDEYDECVVIAKDENEAFSIAAENYFYFEKDKVDITEIKLNESKPVLGSFCAG